MNREELKKAALAYHEAEPKGKLGVISTKPTDTALNLALTYTPGVADVCLEIEKDVDNAYKYTGKGNLVAVISNGTAVLGLGDIGAAASKPVMEGKAVLFKILADINVYDIEVDTTSIEEFISTVKNIAPTFGGINLEDIKAPECFEIERRLIDELDIPVMHDDQHGTAIITSAALLNALKIANKRIEDIKIVVNGAGAAGIGCTKMYKNFGVKAENIIMCDSKGVITKSREDLTPEKDEFATSRTDLVTLSDALKGADMFLGLSKADILTQDMIRTMAKDPIVFALANPNPEIDYNLAMATRDDIIMATGRSDYPNQVNNVLGFPYIFKGALQVRAKKITEKMKMAAALAISSLATEPLTQQVIEAHNMPADTQFGRKYILPKPLDKRLRDRVSDAVAKAAMEQ